VCKGARRRASLWPSSQQSQSELGVSLNKPEGAELRKQPPNSIGPPHEQRPDATLDAYPNPAYPRPAHNHLPALLASPHHCVYRDQYAANSPSQRGSSSLPPPASASASGGLPGPTDGPEVDASPVHGSQCLDAAALLRTPRDKVEEDVSGRNAASHPGAASRRRPGTRWRRSGAPAGILHTDGDTDTSAPTSCSNELPRIWRLFAPGARELRANGRAGPVVR
jgi:hypothetical protein